MIFYLKMLQPPVVFLISIVAAVLLCCAPITVDSAAAKSDSDETATPIIGVLTQEVTSITRKKFPDRNLSSYIAASYIKFVEGAGARAVPIWIGESPEYYKDIVTKVNGILFPGGAALLNSTRGYADAAHHIFKGAIELNKKGIYFPIFAICLGFELLTYLDSNRTEHRRFQDSKLFGDAPSDVIKFLKKYPVTANFHHFCITRETFKEHGFEKNWKILSINHDWNNFEFISSIEHKKYPFYGVQYHPEKNLYEFIPNRGIPHSIQAIRIAQYFADFFVKETRKNKNKFLDSNEEENSLIYNYAPEFSGRVGSLFAQQYLFDKKITASSSPSCDI